MCENGKLFTVLQSVADVYCDGHFTVMKFTTGWRVCFGDQPGSREDINTMARGKTLKDAVLLALREV